MPPSRPALCALGPLQRAWLLSVGMLLQACGDTEMLAAGVDEPPGGFLPRALPQLVSVTFDDNFVSGYGSTAGGMRWALDLFEARVNPVGTGEPATFDGTPARTTFFCNSLYIAEQAAEPVGLGKLAWHLAYASGHEIGNHTHSHPNGRDFSRADWRREVLVASDWLTRPFVESDAGAAPDPRAGPGVPAEALRGFRAPYLAYNDALYAVLSESGFHYDSSVEACWGQGERGTNCSWPYELDRESDDNRAAVKRFSAPVIEPHPGLWELPVSTLFVPPDELVADYGASPGIARRIAVRRIQEQGNHFEESTGRVSPVDIGLFVDAALSGAEVLAILEYSLDLRLNGNRAPMIFVAHTHVYADSYRAAPHTTLEERQRALEAFIDYALSKPDVRLRPLRDVLEFVQHPTPLAGTGARAVQAGFLPELGDLPPWVRRISEWVARPLVFGLLAFGSLGLFVVSLLGVPWFVTRLPADYFTESSSRPAGESPRDVVAPEKLRRRAAVRLLLRALKNGFGLVLLAGGLVMLFTPGQGLLTLLAASFFIDFPGKRRIQRWVIRRPAILRSVNRLRERRGRPPLAL